MIIEQKPKYTPLIQKPDCCGPTSLQWVLYRRKLPIFSQEEIGKYVGLRIAKKYKRAFTHKFGIAKRKIDEGVHLIPFVKGIKKLFHEKKIKLKVNGYYITQINNPKKFIIENIKNGNDVIINAHFKPINKGRYAHYCVIAKIRTNKETFITLGDPDGNFNQFYEVKLGNLVEGMLPKWGYKIERGFIVISD